MKILNIGSLNIDYVYELEHFVLPKETISANKQNIYPGGKGLNQSIALSKAKIDVYHCGIIGKDGKLLKDTLKENGINLNYLKETDGVCGHAIIQIEEKTGQNSIIIYRGSNYDYDQDFITEVIKNFDGEYLLLQNETNLLKETIEIAKEKGLKIFLNAAPANHKISNIDLNKIDLLIVNEVEAEFITNKKQPKEMIKTLKEKYPNLAVVLTLGQQGSIYSDLNTTLKANALKLNAIDTTAAGDCFSGYFIASYVKEDNIKNALALATYASGMSVLKKGASTSIPEYDEVVENLNAKKYGEVEVIEINEDTIY